MSSSNLQYFFGIDISKDVFDIAIFADNKTYQFDNNNSGISKFYKEFKTKLQSSFVVLENTGGYELKLLLFLHNRSITIHRADTRKAKNFIRSYGGKAKSDSLDAIALSLYAKERQHILPVYIQKNETLTKLQYLNARRLDLTQMQTQEKNRYQSPVAEHDLFFKKSTARVLKHLKLEIERIEEEIRKLVESSDELKIKSLTLQTIDGIGEKTAMTLIALMPELGSLTRREIAALSGLAPYAYESGKHIGYRRTYGGRVGVKQCLYMSAMSAARCKTGKYSAFYKKLIESGKKPMVAIVALARKIIVVANAKIRDLQVI